MNGICMFCDKPIIDTHYKVSHSQGIIRYNAENNSTRDVAGLITSTIYPVCFTCVKKWEDHISTHIRKNMFKKEE